MQPPAARGTIRKQVASENPLVGMRTGETFFFHPLGLEGPEAESLMVGELIPIGAEVAVKLRPPEFLF